ALEIADGPTAQLSLKRELGALRVVASDDARAAQHFERAVEDVPATSLHALRSRIEVADVEVIKPEGVRDLRRLGGHAADLLPVARDQLIGAGEAVRPLPAEKPPVEGRCLFPVGGELLVPANAARAIKSCVERWAGSLPFQ